MHALGILSLIAQVFFAVHAVRTGRQLYWVFIIVVFPGVGSLVYFFSEYLPELQQGTKGKKIRGGKPGSLKRRRFLEDQLEITPSIKNKKDLAEEYVNAGMFDKAIALYESCLQGLNEDDPVIVEGLCCAYFFKGDFKTAKDKLLNLIELRGKRNWDEFDLMLARTYEELGETGHALKEYAAMEKAFPGEEARCRYALLLKKTGDIENAKRLFNQTVKNLRLSPKYHQKAQKRWADIAKRNI